MHVVVAIALLQPAGFDPDFVALFTPLEYRYTGGGYQDELFRYRLFIPETQGRSQQTPLIVWLHGKGEAGGDNIAHVRWLDHLIFKGPWNRGEYPFFLLAVQCPFDNSLWTRGDAGAGDDMINVVMAILDKTLQGYAIDRDRVYLAGVSSGGSGCWELAMRHPKYFAAVAPLASGGGDNARLEKLKAIPVWAFHSRDDTGAPVEPVRSSVRSLKAIGGKAHLTEVESRDHDCWTAAFNEYHLLEWLLCQRRGQVLLAPGAISWSARFADFMKTWQWWQILVQVGVPAVLLLAVWNAFRRRARIARTRGVAP